ncbi:MAG: DUF1476 domain-containing protein [Rhodobacteraceae bacterium]|nr:DUF1476 domain-containing protein [Paracoccaceae bacterium]MBR9821889.1 DUF1476 domain-containing protein [Paracoccaceae bacterium]
MASLKDREAAFEAKFAHDSEMLFRAEVRCNRALGHWAAGLLGHEGPARDEYLAALLRADLGEPGHEDLIRKLTADLQGRADEATIRARHAQALSEAKAELSDT